MSLLDNELESFLTQQVVFHKYKNLTATYIIFHKDINLSKYNEKIAKEISIFICSAKFGEKELDYLRSLGYFKEDYLKMLANFDITDIKIEYPSSSKFKHEIRIIGPWEKVLLLATPIRNIISQIYYSEFYKSNDILKVGDQTMKDNFKYIKEQALTNFRFYDGGTKYRFSFPWQLNVVSRYCYEFKNNFLGSTNLLICKAYNLKPIGTFGREYMMGHFAIGGTNKISLKITRGLQDWLDEYENKLKIANTDAYGMDSFFKTCDHYISRVYQGFKCESGNPHTWTQKLFEIYKITKVDKKDKLFIYATNGTFLAANLIHRTFQKAVTPIFEMGEELTNNMGFAPLKLSVELAYINNIPTFYNSDDTEKVFCDDKKGYENLLNLKPVHA